MLILWTQHYSCSVDQQVLRRAKLFQVTLTLKVFWSHVHLHTNFLMEQLQGKGRLQTGPTQGWGTSTTIQCC